MANGRYIGDSSMTCLLAEHKKEGCNLILNKLRVLAVTPSPAAFPPPSEATIVKATDDVACSSQPTAEQIAKLGSQGFASVLCLTSCEDASFYGNEEAAVRSQGMTYVHVPCCTKDRQSDVCTLTRALEALRQAPKPCLMHDNLGACAATVTLLHVALDVTPLDDRRRWASQFAQWSKDMGVDTSAYQAVAVDALNAASA